MSPKKSLTATNLAVYQQLGCDLYIHNVYNGTSSSGPHTATASPSELSKAHFKRGLDWEAHLYSWLDSSQLLLKVPSVPLDPSSLLENILADDRKHFFITGLSFWPPKTGLAGRFSSLRSEPLTFGLAKPDLLEIKQTDTGIYWRVIDAKASKHVKTSHHIQIYFYTLCLNYLLTQPQFRNADSAGIWLAPKDGFDIALPSMDDIKTISISLLSPTLDSLLFRDLPKIISAPIEDVKWHYNPLCRGCRYESECRSKAQALGELGSMPNISIDDAKTLKDLLRISRVSNIPNSGVHLPDIEELHQLVGNTTRFENIAKSSPTIVMRAKHILGLPKKIRVQQLAAQSPVIEAVRGNNIQIVPRRNFTCPQKEDVAVIISIVNDPSSPNSNGDHFCITTHCETSNIVLPTSISCSASVIIVELAGLLRLVNAVRKACGTPCTSQVYVWSSNEQSLLQTHIINAALTSTANDQDIRMCIGALAQGASLLQTTFQPILLSGALLSFLGKGRRLKAEYKACLERMGLSTEGTVEILKKRVENEVRRLQESTAPGYEERRKELGQLPRVVVLKKEIERQLALPIPGYWDFPECVSILLPGAEACPSDEQIFAAYKNPQDAHELGKLLLGRNTYVYLLLNELRKRALSTKGISLLVNDAKILSTHFMDLCRETHIRKLFFMQQFEVLTKLSDLWQARIDACPEAPTLEFCNVIQGTNGVEHVFRLLSGAVDVPSSDRDHAFYDKLLVLDTPDVTGAGDTIPVEALFDDLGVSGLVFPLNRYTRASWSHQHCRVQKELMLADVRNVYADRDRLHTLVSLRTWGTASMKFEEGAIYRLSPRLIDFNTAKVLSSLFEIDLSWGSEEEFYEDDDYHPHRDIPFLQLVIEPNSLGKIAVARQFVKIEREIQKLFRDLKGLGNDVAGSLVLKASQHTATQRILSNRLSVIWGPPGTGKTYTISLSLLRLIEVERRQYGPQRKVVFITAITHAAIEACRSKLVHLMDAYRSIDDLPNKWLEDVKIEVVSRGSDHPAPSKYGSNVQIYAGTIYQLYNFTKKYSIQVDCVVIDEAGQISLGSISLVLRSLSPDGRIIIAGDSEQLAPILSGQYPLLKSNALFGSVLDCIMFSKSATAFAEKARSSLPSPDDDGEMTSTQETIVQLTENFRLNPDLGEFVSTIYSRQFKPQKVQARQLAVNLGTLTTGGHQYPSLSATQNITRAVQKFFVALSEVMLRQPQSESVLAEPELHSTTPSALLKGTSKFALTHRPVSLALIRLRSWSARTPHIPYELHVHGEAAVAASLVASLQQCCPNDDIFVATPHRIQREAVKAALTRATSQLPMDVAFERMHLASGDGKPNVIVDTIERLQGSEAAFVICLFSVPKNFTSDIGFLLERRRLNVAISRAKTLCILISSDEVLCPSVKVLANDETAKGYAFLKAYEKRAWSFQLPVNVDNMA